MNVVATIKKTPHIYKYNIQPFCWTQVMRKKKIRWLWTQWTQIFNNLKNITFRYLHKEHYTFRALDLTVWPGLTGKVTNIITNYRKYVTQASIDRVTTESEQFSHSPFSEVCHKHVKQSPITLEAVIPSPHRFNYPRTGLFLRWCLKLTCKWRSLPHTTLDYISPGGICVWGSPSEEKSLLIIEARWV